MSLVEVLPALPSVAATIGRAALTRHPANRTRLEREVRVDAVELDAVRLAAYDRLCGFALRDRLPATWPHVLIFALQAHLMAAPEFPLPMAGIVHVSNRIVQGRPLLVGDRPDLRCRSTNFVPHRRGTAFDLVGEARLDGQLVWTGVSTYLALGRQLPGLVAQLPPQPDVPEVAVDWAAHRAGTWRLPADLGRRYAAVSGDYNPIHLSGLTARPFGFARPIIHGMYPLARALAVLDPRLPATFALNVDFTKPIQLPARVDFSLLADTAGWRFAVISGTGRPHLVGAVTADSDAA